jgi:gluconate 2-dehydrogenase gamma chain
MSKFSRRAFLGMGAAATAAITIFPGCTRPTREDGAHHPEGSADRPQAGLAVPEAGTVGRFLNPDQLAIVAAVAGRIIPGDEQDPGAVEAGVVDYIDRLLATHETYPQRTYVQPPFAETYDGDEPPPPEDGIIWVHEDEVERYGWQSGYTPREIYRMGLARLDELARQRHDTVFTELDEDEQDALLEAMEEAEDDDVAELFEPVGADVVFELIRKHTVEGFFADPLYGGNRGLVGWQLVGFPGAQRGYAPAEMLDPDFSREPQSLAELAMLHGDHGDPDALGSVRRRHPAGPLD